MEISKSTLRDNSKDTLKRSSYDNAADSERG